MDQLFALRVLALRPREHDAVGERERTALTAPTAPLTGDALLTAVTTAMVTLHERYYHRAPTSAKSQLMGDEQDRALSAGDRERSADARSQTTGLRDANATRRDTAADERDAAAHARDRIAAEIDGELELLEHELATGNVMHVPAGADLLKRATDDRRRAASGRSRAAEHRDAAASDRRQAADDREQAASDRRAAADALMREGVDHLTGALTRRAG